MWQIEPKKTVFTLCVDNYAPEITEITFPLLKAYADKIRADFHIITERKFPEYPPVYEKIQIYELAQQMENDWNIYIDADALIHPDLMDLTEMLPKDTVAHHGKDFAPIRWKLDRFFRRDGRFIGSGNWFTIASDWCIELWKPCEDMTLEEIYSNISPTVNERTSGCFDRTHLIDDYILSRNIAKYGLKFKVIREMMTDIGFPNGGYFFWHAYTMPIEQKVREMRQILAEWRL